MELLVRNGILVTGAGQRREDILIRDGKIAEIGEDLEYDEFIPVADAAGCLVFPGFIDVHTHLDMECAAGVTADDFPSGTRAALAGGTTCIVDFATQDKGGTLEQALDFWHTKADGRSACDYGFHMAITDWTDDIPEQMAEMCRRGVTSFKIYLAYDNLRLTPEQVGKVLEAAAKLGAVVCAHCEDGDAVNRGVAEQKAAGHMDTGAHPVSRPNQVEADAVEQFLDLADKAGAEAYVVHLSTREGLEVIRAHREKGQTVWVETCPQYLTLTDEVYSLPNFEGAKYVCSPPIRSEADREALRGAVQAGEIQVIATDHCSFTWEQKLLGRHDFSQIPNGLPGLQHRPVVMYGLSKGDCPLTPMQLCKLLSEDPARIYGLYPQKGSLEIGADADLVIWDPEAPVTVRAEEQLHNVEYTPFEGISAPGSPKMVLLDGAVVMKDGRVTKDYRGRFVPRKTR